MNLYKWVNSEVPVGLEIRQVYGFIFSVDGRILLLEDKGKYNLPGGRPESGEGLFDTLIREAEEEVQVTITSVEYLGYQLITQPEAFAQVRLVALIDQIQAPATDPSTGRQYKRRLVPPSHVNDLLGWEESGNNQITSAVKAVSILGVFWEGTPLANQIDVE